MLLKHLPIAALAAYAFAQEDSRTLNATLSGKQELSNLTQLLSTNPALLRALDQARNITILAPSNEAFARAAQSPAFASVASNVEALSAVLMYHVLNGTIESGDIEDEPTFVPTYLVNSTYSNVTGGQVVEAVKQGDTVSFYSGLLSRANVTEADLDFNGGTVHIINSVLSPPVNVLETASAFNLTGLRGALNATNLAPALASARDVTIFAPNNEAFTNINSEISKLDTQTLSNILAYHVVNGTVGYSSDLRNGMNLTAADGRNIMVTIRDGNVFVNQAKVVTPNVLIGNGVVHVIDAVLNPTNTTGPSQQASSGANAYPSASRSGSDVPFTSNQPMPSTTVNPSTATGSNNNNNGAGQTQSQAGAPGPMATGAVGYGVVLGVAAAWFL